MPILRGGLRDTVRLHQYLVNSLEHTRLIQSRHHLKLPAFDIHSQQIYRPTPIAYDRCSIKAIHSYWRARRTLTCRFATGPQLQGSRSSPHCVFMHTDLGLRSKATAQIFSKRSNRFVDFDMTSVRRTDGRSAHALITAEFNYETISRKGLTLCCFPPMTITNESLKRIIHNTYPVMYKNLSS